MTTLDLAAICERHDVKVEYDDDAQTWIGQTGVLEGDESAFIRGAESEQFAICALLKARWGMTTRPTPGHHTGWDAYSLEHIGRSTYGVASMVPGARGTTELAAVVALADRLAGGQA